ncbi:hypothetical protein ACWIUD_11280 [Helicobacter sp. 23-1044]
MGDLAKIAESAFIFKANSQNLTQKSQKSAEFGTESYTTTSQNLRCLFFISCRV